jgi:hypothetical protein
MNPPTNNWGQRRTEHRLYEETVTDITTRNLERKGTTHKKYLKMSNMDPTKKPGVNWGAGERYQVKSSNMWTMRIIIFINVFCFQTVAFLLAEGSLMIFPPHDLLDYRHLYICKTFLMSLLSSGWWCPAFVVNRPWSCAVRRKYGKHEIQITYEKSHCIFIS